MPLTQITNHEARAIALLLQQLQGKPALEALVAALSVGLNTQEAVLFDMLNKRLDITQAEGVQLDGVGDFLNTARQGYDDATFRTLLLQSIALHRSHGLGDELIQLARMSLLTDGGGVFLDEYEDAPLEFTAYERGAAGEFLPGGLSPEAAEDVWRLLNRGRSAATYFVFIWGDEAATIAAPGFRFDTPGITFDGPSRWRLGSKGGTAVSAE